MCLPVYQNVYMFIHQSFIKNREIFFTKCNFWYTSTSLTVSSSVMASVSDIFQSLVNSLQNLYREDLVGGEHGHRS